MQRLDSIRPDAQLGAAWTLASRTGGVAPAVGNAVLDAVGVNVDEIPITPEKVWRALKVK